MNTSHPHHNSTPFTAGRCSSLSLVIPLLALFLLPPAAHSAPITPFYTQNQSPVALIFGLPAPDNAALLPAGKLGAILALDIANNFAQDTNGNESILLDGESYRVNLALRYGIAKGVEGGIDIPYVGIGGGIFDRFIEGWHSFFGLPQEGRPSAPRNRLLYVYTKDGQTRLLLDDSASGLGDIRLSGGVQLYNDGSPNPRQVALRASVKLPTGSSSGLRGSGSTDFALWLTAADDYRLPALGHMTLFGAAGGMAMTDGDVLRDQQRNLAAFGTLGLGWGPAEVIDFKAQLSGHTAFFQGSELRELARPALHLIVGGTLNFSPTTSLDIGVSEDVAVNTSPDVALHLALRQRF
ncbi:MAG TPA: DUF3187 family protein [Desulfuromonadaceae bacterium]